MFTKRHPLPKPEEVERECFSQPAKQKHWHWPEGGKGMLFVDFVRPETRELNRKEMLANVSTTRQFSVQR